MYDHYFITSVTTILQVSKDTILERMFFYRKDFFVLFKDSATKIYLDSGLYNRLYFRLPIINMTEYHT